MGYSTSTIGGILRAVNQTHFLPAIQRPFVWSSDQVIALFDSLLKGYPISSFMFWAVSDETKHDVKIYRFIEDYRAGAANEPARPEGRDVVLVLDGQQRLTSLLVGLRGTFSEKAKNRRSSNPDAWTRKELYLDLLKDPDAADEDEDAEFGVTYGLKFHDRPPRNDHRHQWVKLGKLLDYADEDRFEVFVTDTISAFHRGTTAFERELAENTLRRLHKVIWKDETINYYTETSQSSDRVLDIFVRANDAGTKLSKSDLMMSMITSKWSSDTARDEIHAFVDYINKGMTARNAIRKDFVLKSALVLCDFDVKYNVANFSADAVARIEASWSAIKAAVERGFRLVNSFGIDAENLTSLNALLPLIYYLSRHPDFTFLGSSEFERTNARRMRTWLLNSLLVGAFAGSSDRTISIARATIRDGLRADRGFPIAALFDALATSGRVSKLDERGVEDLLDLKYGKPKTFLALSLLYDDRGSAGIPVQVDHIIPRSDADRRVLMAQNLPEHRIREITSCRDRLGNLQLLLGPENLDKHDIPFASWITGRDHTYRSTHLIPERPDLWSALNLPEFIAEREKLIRKRFLSLGYQSES